MWNHVIGGESAHFFGSKPLVFGRAMEIGSNVEGRATTSTRNHVISGAAISVFSIF
jgi:hypothetical protein